jgi:hypothetical protein
MATGYLLPISALYQGFSDQGIVGAGYKINTYVGGSVSTPVTTYTDSTLGTPNSNPIVLGSNGRFQSVNCWVPAGTLVKLVLTDAANNVITGGTIDNVGGVNDLSALSAGAIGAVLWPQTSKELAASVTPVSLLYPADPVADLRRYCNLVLDSSTDNTSAITGAWTLLSTYRGEIAIPYGCKFTKSTVYIAVPVGLLVYDYSSVNTGQPPGYKNKSFGVLSNNTASDDSFSGIIDGHHPVLRINNLGTAGTSSATNRYHSILRAAGFRWNNDSIDGMQWLTSLSGRGTFWRVADITNTTFNFMANYAAHWTALTVYAAASKMNTSDGNAWLTVSGGTSASTEPVNASNGPAWQGLGYISGTTFTVVSTTNAGPVAIGQAVQGTGVTADTRITGGSAPNWTVNNSQTIGAVGSPVALQTAPTYTDGTVQWTWQGAWNASSTRFFYDDDGYGSLICPYAGTARFGVDGVSKNGLSINFNEFTGDTSLTDNSRSIDLIKRTNTAGSYLGGVTSLFNGGAISGTTPAITASLHTVNNGGATQMTNIILPANQTLGYVVLFFTNSNTTVKASGFNLKNNVDVNPISGNVMTFMKDPSISGNWTEISRNF